jgi:hypothetical protein
MTSGHLMNLEEKPDKVGDKVGDKVDDKGRQSAENVRMKSFRLSTLELISRC